MKTKFFLVGGFVRDKLICIENIERDWVIIKSNFKIMFKSGFKLVGKDFPVFLNPLTKEEYALARAEKKIKKGYKGFKCYFSKKIKLKYDIYRRDLNINTLILKQNGYIIDFFKVKKYFKNKTIKHIANTFSEDPLRILRLARFQTKYYNKNFIISSYTYFLIKSITSTDELSHLKNERIIKELNLSLTFNKCQIFFYLMYQTKALHLIFNDLHTLIKTSIFYKKNIYTNIWTQLCNILLCLNKSSNNVLLKISIIIYKIKENYITTAIKKTNLLLIKYKTKFLLSKKWSTFIQIFITFSKLFYKNSNIKKIEQLFNKIKITKNKIKLINSLLLCENNSKINDHINIFQKKYIILELLNNNSKINKNIKKKPYKLINKKKLYVNYKNL